MTRAEQIRGALKSTHIYKGGDTFSVSDVRGFCAARSIEASKDEVSSALRTMSERGDIEPAYHQRWRRKANAQRWISGQEKHWRSHTNAALGITQYEIHAR